jgi:hypothetical protein
MRLAVTTRSADTEAEFQVVMFASVRLFVCVCSSVNSQKLFGSESVTNCMTKLRKYNDHEEV